MRALAGVAALLLLNACGSGALPANQQKSASPPPSAPAPPKAETAGNASAPADPGLAEMSPSRRRAYDRGFSDCSAGRYDPDRYPEAYRIGCAAAHDR